MKTNSVYNKLPYAYVVKITMIITLVIVQTLIFTINLLNKYLKYEVYA